MNTKELDIKSIAVLVGALGYLICPMDIVPDALPGIGFADDGAALMAAFKAAFSLFSDSSISAARKKTNDIFGSNFNQEQIDALLRAAEESSKKRKKIF